MPGSNFVRREQSCVPGIPSHRVSTGIRSRAAGVPGTQLCRCTASATRRVAHNYATWHFAGTRPRERFTSVANDGEASVGLRSSAREVWSRRPTAASKRLELRLFRQRRRPPAREQRGRRPPRFLRTTTLLGRRWDVGTPSASPAFQKAGVKDPGAATALTGRRWDAPRVPEGRCQITGQAEARQRTTRPQPPLRTQRPRGTNRNRPRLHRAARRRRSR